MRRTHRQRWRTIGTRVARQQGARRRLDAIDIVPSRHVQHLERRRAIGIAVLRHSLQGRSQRRMRNDQNRGHRLAEYLPRLSRNIRRCRIANHSWASTQRRAEHSDRARNDATGDQPAASKASIARPMPHCRQNTPAKITRLNADKARPAQAAGNTCATAGWLSETLVDNTHQSAQCAAPAAGPSMTITTNSSMLVGRAQLIKSCARTPVRAKRGMTRPQDMKANSMARLMANSPSAAWVPTNPRPASATGLPRATEWRSGRHS